MEDPTTRRLPQRLQPGDRVVVLSPSSWPEDPGHLEGMLDDLASWGLRPEPSAHAFGRRGYMAGTPADRLEDLNGALRDPGVRALVASRGGCGALRLLAGVDRSALERDPKPLVGYSGITALHQVWRRSGVPGVHGAVHGAHRDLVRSQLLDAASTTATSDPASLTTALTTSGVARGDLVGGNLELMARTVGVVDVR
ncbi:LD-carboxypeptidase [Quadrisphaera oryzae]|uniref:LD-carboxypeptidase n=1 Tax=Quadrisphaera TaxID=317661 RepID=UPI0016478454|nr:LD-carboxypeptidase [Quadrisphaera sp. RL12-1S]